MAILIAKEVQEEVGGYMFREAIKNNCIDTPNESAKNSLIIEKDLSWKLVNNFTSEVISHS